MTNYNKNYIKLIISLFFILAGFFALAIAWFLQYVWTMIPCSLCIIERWPYRILIVLGFIGLLIPKRYVLWILWGGLLILMFSIGVSFVHIGVEQGWWKSPLPECNAYLYSADNFSDRLNFMPDRPTKPCDVASYLFFWMPLSLTMLNGLYSFFLFVIVIWRLIAEKHDRRIYF